MSKNSYIITSGWWCDDDRSANRDVKYGSSEQRQAQFFNLWYAALTKNTNACLVVVVDSASPIKPDYMILDKLNWVTLRQNAGHSTRHFGQYSGYTHGVITGMLHALLEDVDYWVYIEQDVLISGNGIIEYAISKMKGSIMFGCGKGTPQPLQQSVMIFKKDALRKFVRNFFKIRYRDSEVSPEKKFAIAASSLLSVFPNILRSLLIKKNLLGGVTRKIFAFFERSKLRGWDSLPFGYGRARPINHNDEYYYFQHGSEEEIGEYKKRFYGAKVRNE